MHDLKKSLPSILEALSGTKSGEGWKCVCPAHNDLVASLSVTESNGKILFYCHAGCSFDQIKSALSSRGLMTQQKPTLRAVSSKIEAVYDYTDANGELLFQKVRKEGKKFYHRKKGEDGKWVYKNATKGIEIPLYRLPEVIANDTCVFICEGEKDADKIRSLGGLTATTNFDGAGKWKESYNRYFKDKNVYVCEDNDEAGRKHAEMVARSVSKVAKELRIVKFANLPEKSDVSDFLVWQAENPNTFLDDDFFAYCDSFPLFTPNPDIEFPEPDQDEPTKKKIAAYSEYADLYNTVLKNPRRDLFSGKLMTLDDGVWCPAKNYLNVLKSRAARLEENGHPKFHRGLIEDHLHAFELDKTPEFIVDVPEWDGVDRIKMFTDAIELEPTDVTQEDFEQLVKEWLAKSMMRLHDPRVRNRILILKGAQEIGKDTWIDNLVGGAGQFANRLSIVAGDKDTFLQLNRGLFIKIAEFDKSARTEVSLLKDLITTPDTDLRAPFERDAKRRYSRCSFISSCNVNDILRDHTGASRYLVFEVMRINWDYPTSPEDQLQILAQAQDLASKSYAASAQSRKAMNDYLQGKTPEDPSIEICETFCDLAQKHLEQMDEVKRREYTAKGWMPNSELNEVIAKTAQFCGTRPRNVRLQLKQQRLWIKSDSLKGYTFVMPEQGRL